MHVFCTFGSDLHAQSVLSNKISASDPSRKFVKSECVVGRARTIDTRTNEGWTTESWMTETRTSENWVPAYA